MFKDNISEKNKTKGISFEEGYPATSISENREFVVKLSKNSIFLLKMMTLDLVLDVGMVLLTRNWLPTFK